MLSIFRELRRRNVFRVAGVYAVVGWLLAQIAVTLETSLKLPDWFDSVIVSALIIGLPLAMLFAWAFEITPDGVVRVEKGSTDHGNAKKTARKLDIAIVSGLIGVIGMIGWQIQSRDTVEFAAMEFTPDTNELQIEDVPASYTSEINRHDTETELETIAVLPFEDFSPEKDQDYFASGISEELLNVLTRIDGLRVSSRTSAFAFKDKSTPISVIAEALNVAHVLEGSVRKSGKTLRITAQLIDTEADIHMWSETYDRPLTADNIFAIQDEIAQAIVGELKGRLKFDTQKNVLSRTSSVAAYDFYLQARDEMNKREADALANAIGGFKKAIALDPDFSLAYAGLADAILLTEEYAGADEKDTISHARINVEKALQLAPNSAEALTAAASLSLNEYDYPKALELASKAIEANPNFTLAYHRKALAYSGFQPEKALGAFQQALVLDPLSPVLLSNVSSQQMALGDIAAARKTSEKNIHWNPQSPHGYIVLGTINWDEANYAEAHRLYKEAQALNPDSRQARTYLLTLYTDLGMAAQARPLATTPFFKAFLHTIDNEPDKARSYLNELTTMDQANLAYHIGDFKLATQLLKPLLQGRFPKDEPITSEIVHEAAKVAAMFGIVGEDDGVNLISRLEAYFKDKIISEQLSYGNLYGGALLQIAKGTPRDAIPWLKHRVDLGYADFDVSHKIFQILSEDPDFIAIKARNDENSIRQRRLLEAQLASAPANWVVEQGLSYTQAVR